MAVTVTTGDSFTIGEETALFPAGDYRWGAFHSQYDVTADGQRFLMLKLEATEEVNEEPMILILNWFTEVEELVGGGPCGFLGRGRHVLGPGVGGGAEAHGDEPS